MSTSMYAATLLVDPSLKSHTFETANDLMMARPLELKPRAGLRTYADAGKEVVTEVAGSSKGDFLAWSVRKMCEEAGIAELKFLHSDPDLPCHWRLPLGIEDGEEEVYGQVCGYWLEGAQLSAEYAALSALLEWARAHPDNANEDTLKDIDEGNRMHSSNPRDASYAEEGNGDGYLFAYLGTARHVLGNALVAGKAVLHVAEIFD